MFLAMTEGKFELSRLYSGVTDTRLLFGSPIVFPPNHYNGIKLSFCSMFIRMPATRNKTRQLSITVSIGFVL